MFLNVIFSSIFTLIKYVCFLIRNRVFTACSPTLKVPPPHLCLLPASFSPPPSLSPPPCLFFLLSLSFLLLLLLLIGMDQCSNANLAFSIEVNKICFLWYAQNAVLLWPLVPCQCICSLWCLYLILSGAGLWEGGDHVIEHLTHVEGKCHGCSWTVQGRNLTNVQLPWIGRWRVGRLCHILANCCSSSSWPAAGHLTSCPSDHSKPRLRVPMPVSIEIQIHSQCFLFRAPCPFLPFFYRCFLTVAWISQ